MGRTSCTEWTESESEQLQSLFAQNLTYSEIAIALGKSVKAVNGKINRLGLRKKNRWTKAEIEALCELVGDIPIRRLAAQYNQWAVKNGYPTRSRATISVKANRLGESRKLDSCDWYTAAQIAACMGCCHSTINYWLNHYKKDLKPTAHSQCPNGVFAVSRKRLRAFLIKYPEICDRHKATLDLFWLIDLLASR